MTSAAIGYPDGRHKYQTSWPRAVELVAEIGSATDNFDDLFATARPDMAGALDGVHDDTNMPFDKEPAQFRTDLQDVLVHRTASSWRSEPDGA